MERFSKKEKVRFLDIARASCAELITQIYKGLKIKNEVEEISKILTALIKGINNAK